MINKRGFDPLGIIILYWWIIAIAILIILAYNFAQDYFLPEYCVTDTIENRNTISAYEFELSNEYSSENKVCFRSKDQELVQGMIIKMNDKRLEKEFELQQKKEENMHELVTTLLEPKYFYPILAVFLILSLAYIGKKK